MKKYLFLVVTTLLLSVKLNAQVGIGTTSPDLAAALDIVSSDRGLLLPRVGDTGTITTPVAGLMIFDISKQCMKYYNGTIWSDCMGGIVPVFACGDPMTDIDGNSYPTVLIGTQCWMAADLKVSKYPNGDAIPYIDLDATWGALADTDTADAYSFYDDNNNDGIVDIAHSDYGALYSYSAAIADDWVRDNNPTDDTQGVCPDGWHLPSNPEWNAIGAFLGGTAGDKMKESGHGHWDATNGGTNSSGFTALPNGYRRRTGGNSISLGEFGTWWTNRERPTDVTKAFIRYIEHDANGLVTTTKQKSHGYCVRCIKD